MEALVKRSTFAPARRSPPSLGARLRHLLSALAYTAAERLPSLQREMPSEFYRFPPF